MAQLGFLLLVQCSSHGDEDLFGEGQAIGFKLCVQFKSSPEGLGLTLFQFQLGIPVEDGVNKVLLSQQVFHIFQSERIG